MVEKNEKIEEFKIKRVEKCEKIDKKQINEEIKTKYNYIAQEHQFKFETSQEIANILHTKICESIETETIMIEKAFILKVLENFDYLRKCQIENRELEEKYHSTIVNYNKMQERLINQENVLKTIEFTYQEKINNIDYTNQEKMNLLVIENKSLKNLIESNERNISLQTENFKEEISQFQETIKKSQNVKKKFKMFKI